MPRIAFIASLSVATVTFISLELFRFSTPPTNRYWQKFYSFTFGLFVRRVESRKITGATYLLIGSLLTALIFPREIAAAAILFLAFGDPLATVIGIRFGRTRIKDKSLEGHTACLLVCIAIGIIVSALWSLPMATLTAGAVTATFFQALSIKINDNLTIPITAGGIMLLVNFYLI